MPDYPRGRTFFLVIFLTSFLLPGLNAQQPDGNTSEYLPDIDAIIKTKVEFDLDHSLLRFEVRNARFGIKGKINNYMSYKAELDLSDEGKMKMLDAYVKFTPIKDLDFYMGQRKIPFSTDYIRNPAENIFANRSFLAKYINDGMRDIGFYAEYKFAAGIPLNILLGAVNGTGNNNPQWINKPNLVTRLIAGPDKGLRAAVNTYFGCSQYKDNLAMYGGELRYSNGTFLIESEYIRNNWTDTAFVRQHNEGLYIHTWYNFVRENGMICLVTPTARWDLMGNSIFEGVTDASRITIGINIGFEPRQFYSEIRLNYENYFKSSLPIHSDKITLEFVGRF